MPQSSPRPRTRIARITVVDSNHRNPDFTTLPFNERLRRARPVARSMILYGLDLQGKLAPMLEGRVCELLQANQGADDATFLESLIADNVPFPVHDLAVHVGELIEAAYQIGLAAGLMLCPDVFESEAATPATSRPRMAPLPGTGAQ